MAEIGIYWAEFAPANCGHMCAAQKMFDAFGLDALYLFDQFNETDVGASLDERLQMLAEACGGIQGSVALFLATVRDFDELQKNMKSMEGNIHLFLDIKTLTSLSETEWQWLSGFTPCTVICTDKEQRILEQRLAPRPAEFWNIEFSSTTARRMMLLRCGEQYFPPQVLQYAEEHKQYGLGIDYTSLTEDDLLLAVEPLYDTKRFVHAKGCRDTAVELAIHHGADVKKAARAGLLHDITKALPETEQLRLCQKYGIMTECYQGDMAKILHGKTAAAVAKVLFGESSGVCSAIAWHTTGRAGMTLLEKIVYIADYIEPTRSFDGVEQLRALAFQNLDAAVVCGIDMTIEMLKNRNCPINRDSVEAREYLTLGDMK